MKRSAEISPAQLIAQELLTSDDLVTVMGQIETSLGMLFASKYSEKKILAELPEVIRSIIPDSVVGSEKSLDEWLRSVLAELRTMPIAVVSVAYIPTGAEAKELLELVQSGFGRHVIISLQTDATLLAGVRIEYDNQRVQFSLHNDLETVVKEMHAQPQ